MNKVILMGRLTREPESKKTAGENPMTVTRYSLAVPRFQKRDNAEVDYINVVAFGNRGDFAAQYFRKGKRVAIVGELRMNKYTDKEGKERTSTEVIVSEQFFADSVKDGDDYQQPAQPAQTAPSGFVPVMEEEEDMPF